MPVSVAPIQANRIGILSMKTCEMPIVFVRIAASLEPVPT